MTYNYTKFNSIAVALLVFFGVALHDTKLDTMTKMAIALPAAIAVYEGAGLLHLNGEAHTHVEKVSLKDTAKKYTGTTPKLQNRDEKNQKSRSEKHAPKGYNTFDNYNMPILA